MADIFNDNVVFIPDNTYDIGSPDGGTTLQRPRDIYAAQRVLVGDSSLHDDGTLFKLTPIDGDDYIWDKFNHWNWPSKSIFLDDSDNDATTSLGKNQISAGALLSYSWGRLYGIHAGTRLSAGADASTDAQPGGALSVRGPADKTLGTSSANNSTTITSVGTYFFRDVGLGDLIQLVGLPETARVVSITDDLNLVVDRPLGDGTPRAIVLQVDPAVVSDSSGNVHFRVQKDGTLTAGDRAIYTPNFNTKLLSANTLNNTPTSIFSFTLQPNSVYLFEASVAAAKQDQSDRGAFKRMVTVYRDGAGAATIQGFVFKEFSQHSSAMDVNWAVSGNDIQLQVTGDALVQVNWGATVTFQEFISG